MASDIVPVIQQSNPMLSNAASGQPSQEGRVYSPPDSGAGLSKEPTTAAPVDTVSISYMSGQSVADAKKTASLSEDIRKKKTTKNEQAVANNSEKPGVSAKIQFVYDQKGELTVRYLDTANNLVYQVPSELMLQIREAASRSEASVNTKV